MTKKTLERVGQILPWIVIAVFVAILYFRIFPSIDLTEGQGAAPDFELPQLDGSTFRLSDQRGKVVVLNFWATWCPPCRVEIPGFIDLQREFDGDVVFVGVALDEEGVDTVSPYAKEKGINYPVVVDGWHAARAYGGVPSVPTTYLIDRNGEIRYKHVGLLAEPALRNALVPLVEEMPIGVEG